MRPAVTHLHALSWAVNTVLLKRKVRCMQWQSHASFLCLYGRACTWGKNRSRNADVDCMARVQAAEQIVVLDAGRIAEVGTHEELLRQQGQYSRLVSTQSLSLSNV